MSNFELKNIIWGAETPVKWLEGNLVTQAVLDENGVIIQPAVYSEGHYDTDIELPLIADGDEAYYITATIFVKSNNPNFPDFQNVIRVVSLNSMTGFEVDAQREEFVVNYMSSLNSVQSEPSAARVRVSIDEKAVAEVKEEKEVVLVEKKLSWWQRFLNFIK